jgi:glycosyltransferase involved in cell wall biosynthesis
MTSIPALTWSHFVPMSVFEVTSPWGLPHRGITGAEGTLSAAMRRPDPASAERACAGASCGPVRPLIIASMLREEGITGVHTHVRQLRQYLGGVGVDAPVVTPFSWSRALAAPVFGLRRVVERGSRAAGVVWYRYWHEVFLYHALRRRLAGIGDCVVYAQDPPAARAALRARQGQHQRVVLAVHFRISQSDEWADKEQITRGGTVFRRIRRTEREVIPRVDGIVYVSRWAREALLGWFPGAALVPATVIFNFVAAFDPPSGATEPLGDLVTVGNLDVVKNHRYLLDVLAAIREAGQVVTLDIFGEGPLHDDLVRQITLLGLDDQVRLRGFRSDVRNLLPGYRACVHVSYSESSSLAIIEAMAAGLPIVAGNIGPIAELFDDGIEGRYWPLDDPVRAAATLMGLLGSEPDRLKAGACASERFRRDFDAALVAPRLYGFLLEATDQADQLV